MRQPSHNGLWMPDGPQVVVGDDGTVVVKDVPDQGDTSVVLQSSWPRYERAVVAIAGGGTFGTGFFVGSKRIMTAGHVLPSAADLQGRRVQWNLLNGTTPTTLRVDASYFRHDSKLDFTVFAVTEGPVDAVVVTLKSESPAPKVGEGVVVFGHPSGRYLRRSGADNSIISVDKRRTTIKYRADTMSGFSGGPVVSLATGHVVAMHLKGDQSEEYNMGRLLSAIEKLAADA